MSDKNKTPRKKKKKMTLGKGVKIFFLSLIICIFVGGGLLVGSVISVLKDIPEIDPTNINATLNQTSTILNQDGDLIEQIQAEELRTIISIKDMPKHLKDAFISIEDERFTEHMGVDPYGIGAAFLDNIRSGGIVRGASTITQQLARNLYLDNDIEISRKLKEAYLALQIEQILTKDQILEAYLNRSYFGQNAYGIQEAAHTYFSKEAKDLTIAESAMLAGIVKSTVQYQPYYRVSPDKFDSNVHFEVGQIDVLGERMIVVYNEESSNRQKIVLNKMLELGKISQSEYDTAINQDMRASLSPGVRQPYDITSYFTDYVKSQVVSSLVNKLGYSPQDAEDLLFTGGLSIYATIDLEMQQELENIYDNFTEVLVGNTDNVRGPILVDWRADGAQNIIDDKGNLLYFAKSNLLTEDYSLIIESGNYEINDDGIRITSKKLTPYPAHIEVGSFYTIDDKKNLVTHTVGSLTVPEEHFSAEEGNVYISKEYLDQNEDFYSVVDDRLLIPEKYFYIEKNGIVQPQSATVVLDYRTGHIKAVVGGREVEGNRILNRATDTARQPGSVIKPLSVYLPALDNGYNVGTGIDDIPLTYNGWSPRNWYSGFRGINSLRTSVEQSINTNAAKTVIDIGFETSMSYLEKMGIINSENPEMDNFVSPSENSNYNDVGPAALALGGMTKGLSPLEVTAGYGAIANDGVYVEPVAFTKILDRNGNVLLDNTPKETVVVSPQIAYIMKDVLRTTVTNGLSRDAAFAGMAVAGKTGTTQQRADIWFSGFTPHYVSTTWIGNDSPKITVSRTSDTAARFWRYINSKLHENLEVISSFERPEGITTASICTQSGKLATSACTHDARGVVRTEIFAVGTVPTEYCDMHVTVTVCAESGHLANEYCPNPVTRTLIERDPPYKPSDHGGVVPRDWEYNAPTSRCSIHDESSFLDDLIDSLFPPDEDGTTDEGGENGGTPPADGNGENNGGNNGNGNDNGNGNGSEDEEGNGE